VVPIGIANIIPATLRIRYVCGVFVHFIPVMIMNWGNLLLEGMAQKYGVV